MQVPVQSLDRVIGIGAVDPIVSVHPQTNIELKTPHHALFADVSEHLQVAITLFIGQLRDAHLVPRYAEQKGIGKEEVSICDFPDEVIADSKCQVEAIEPLRYQEIEIGRPHGPV